MLIHKTRGRRPRLNALWVTLVAALLTSVVGAAPAGAVAPRTSTAPRTWNVMVGQQSQDGAIQGMAYGPGDIWINKGDTVHWVANSQEIHTVTLLGNQHSLAPFDPTPGNWMVTQTTSGTVTSLTDFRNSGVMGTMPDPLFPVMYHSYDLTFDGTGTFTYYCLVHGAMMKGTVHVRDAGTAYPYSQKQYDAQASQAKATALAAGHRLWAQAQAASDPTHVYVGASNDSAMVMRFIRPTVRIHVSQTVTFDMGRNSFPAPHTVTFGPEPPVPFIAMGDSTAYSGGTLSSGILMPAAFGGPSTFKVTFTKAGTYHYICMLHDGMGMVGDVIVQ